MSEQIEKILTEGLNAGFAGKGRITKISRAGFSGKASDFQSEDGRVYHDEWFTPNHLGGGQELVEVDGKRFTRLYAGGTPDPEALKKLGLTEEEVGKYLVAKIVKHGPKTRLFEDCLPEAEGDWQYSYKVTERFEGIPVVTAIESITFKGILVHVHPFILSPLE